jgi:hypothetical protein
MKDEGGRMKIDAERGGRGDTEMERRGDTAKTRKPFLAASPCLRFLTIGDAR